MTCTAAAVACTLGLALAASAETPRVASLLPFASDAVIETSGAQTLVASARRSLETPVSPGVADLGNPHSPDLEALAAASPTLIVADRLRHARALPDEFSERALWLDLEGVAPTLASLDRLGERIGAARAMRARTDAVRAEIGALRVAAPIRVLALFGTPDQFQVITQRHWLGDLLAQLGAKLSGTGSRDTRGVVPLTDEFVATLRPDAVLIVCHGDPRSMRAALAEKIAQGGAWSALGAAGQSAQILDAQRFGSNPGLQLGDVARELVRVLTPSPAPGLAR